jgi:murein DD-endopeptidase MepM/ murein hydrolase activator NlpD
MSIHYLLRALPGALGLAWVLLAARPAAAQVPVTPPPVPATPPFRLPFDAAPGVDTWLVTQWYGNTQFAYHWRRLWYEAGQGMHFGLDFGAPCGTEVVAIGDGVVTFADSTRFGSGPHNLLIDHGNGFVSLYGHLLETPELRPGDVVRRGQVIGLSGDPDLTCVSRPHLHLEIRDSSYHYAYNPVQMIATDWDTLALFGPRSGFQRDLENPRRWVTPVDQPVVDFWAGPLNDYLRPWPPDWLQ